MRSVTDGQDAMAHAAMSRAAMVAQKKDVAVAAVVAVVMMPVAAAVAEVDAVSDQPKGSVSAWKARANRPLPKCSLLPPRRCSKHQARMQAGKIRRQSVHRGIQSEVSVVAVAAAAVAVATNRALTAAIRRL